MRIGIISAEYPPLQGGVGAYSVKLAKEFVSMGFEVFVFTSAEHAQSDEGIHVTYWAGDWNWRVWGAISEWVDVHYIRVVNLQFQTAAYGMSPWVHFLQNRLSIPLITTFHDLRHPYLFPKAGALRDWIVKYLVRSSAGVIVTNHEDYAHVQDQSHVLMIPIGSNVTTERPADYSAVDWRKKLGIAPDEFVVAHFGFMNHTKGIDTLLDAVAHIKDDLPIRLLMIGGKTGSSDVTNIDYANQIDAQVERLGLQDIINWTGFVNDKEVSAYLWAADILALPYHDGASFRRGSLMAGIEHNCAIISSKPTVDIKEFQHHKNIMLIDIGQSQQLAEAIYDLYEHPDEIDRLQIGAAELKSLFSWDLIAKKSIRFFEAIIGNYRT